jgi:hypothetical protein
MMVYSPIFSYMIVPSQRDYGEAISRALERITEWVPIGFKQTNLNGPSKNHPKLVAMIHILACSFKPFDM